MKSIALELHNTITIALLPCHKLVTATQSSSTYKLCQDITSLKATEQLKDEFIGIAAHELRTPLAALKGFVDMLVVQTQRGRGVPLADWQEEALAEIMVATNRLIEFTEALLDVTRIQAGRLVLSVELRDLVDLVGKVVQGIQATTWDHTFFLYAEPDSLIVPIDALRIEQVLVNLLSNAVKYSPNGGAIELNIQARWQRDEVVMQVRDSGIGIPASQQAHVFQRFIRADNTQGVMGAGLGLYLCREIVERHGGRIWFESLVGQGSTFFIALPLSTHTGAPN